MDISSSNSHPSISPHPSTNPHRILTGSVIPKFAEPDFSTDQNIATNEPVKIDPATMVTISDEGMARQIMEANAATPVTHYAIKTDQEYMAMSYEELIELRNNDSEGYRISPEALRTRDASAGSNFGKASHFAEQKLAEQEVRNNLSAGNVKTALSDFKELARKQYPELKDKIFDVSFKDGKAVISSKSLSKELITKLQNLLDNKTNTAPAKLQNSIYQYNKEALTVINMRLYNERGDFGGSDSFLVHRDNPLTMNEFTKDISYETVGRSNGNFTYDKYSEVAGSTHYGGKWVYKSSIT